MRTMRTQLRQQGADPRSLGSPHNTVGGAPAADSGAADASHEDISTGVPEAPRREPPRALASPAFFQLKDAHTPLTLDTPRAEPGDYCSSTGHATAQKTTLSNSPSSRRKHKCRPPRSPPVKQPKTFPWRPGKCLPMYGPRWRPLSATRGATLSARTAPASRR